MRCRVIARDLPYRLIIDMDDDDIIIESLDGHSRDLISGWGKAKRKPFQFQAKHGRWTFAIFEKPDLEPFDLDIPDDGMYVAGNWREDHASPEAGLKAAREIIHRCVHAYLIAHPRQRG